MLDWIRTYLMTRFNFIREKMSNFEGNLIPRPMKRLDWEVEKAKSWFIEHVGEFLFKVTHTLFTKKFILNLTTRNCSCNFWELVGIPCRHVVSAIQYNREKSVNYVDAYSHIQSYVKSYSQTMSPINGENRWPKETVDPIMPLNYKVKLGRPKKLSHIKIQD